eukprot:CAMPEP_0174380358 /NCGR_PEP_ID=MMETSP0811_2-20130205/123315_1 /TAXON_ID=73025 ORGANISM="Eutreptiella gymnastica-like, Strain CCMP1594" /NCGR_SAMPLE_ID=MMETSP0811_2 /ASSEMBLY_ACC=CAM_ASM_000667 /LENGTH=251 /DNA_ID=CAMNT_0015533193 /DNA_START=185 /DNA_END=939 /DNA_ORIENTATION=+
MTQGEEAFPRAAQAVQHRPRESKGPTPATPACSGAIAPHAAAPGGSWRSNELPIKRPTSLRSESASVAPRALVGASFTHALHPYHGQGRGGLRCPLQPTNKPHTNSPGLQQRCFYPNNGIGRPLLLIGADDGFFATLLVTIALRQSCPNALRTHTEALSGGGCGDHGPRAMRATLPQPSPARAPAGPHPLPPSVDDLRAASAPEDERAPPTDLWKHGPSDAAKYAPAPRRQTPPVPSCNLRRGPGETRSLW